MNYSHLSKDLSFSNSVLIFWAIAILSAVLTYLNFPGLEHTPSYAGNAFQAIYPDSFVGDAYIGPHKEMLEKPLQLSLFYLLVKLGGEIWLDDRFVALFYLAIVFVTLYGIDKIVCLAGLTDIFSRLIIQLVLVQDHQILMNKVSLAHQPDVNHAALAIPVIVWMVYLTLSKKNLWVIVLMGALLISVSVRNTPYVFAFCLIVAAINGSKYDRIAVVTIFAVALAALVYAIVNIVPIPEEHRLILWDSQIREATGEASPFLPFPDWQTMTLRNLMFGGLCFVALFLRAPKNQTISLLKIMIVLGVLSWIVIGLYLLFAPDSIKVPQLIPFHVTRSLRWPQLFAYLVILIILLREIQNNPSIRALIFGSIGIGVLYMIGPGHEFLRLSFFLLACISLLLASNMWLREGPVRRKLAMPDWRELNETLVLRFRQIILSALVLTVLAAYSFSFYNRLPAWGMLLESGVMGNSYSAKWVGTDTYLRYNTPSDAAVLPIEISQENPLTLLSFRNLASRSGRAISVPFPLASIFEMESWKIEAEQKDYLNKIHQAIINKDWVTANEVMNQLIPPPSYVALPSSLLPSRPGDIQPFKVVTVQGENTVLSR